MCILHAKIMPYFSAHFFPTCRDLLYGKSTPFKKCVYLNLGSFQKGFEVACKNIYMAAEKRTQGKTVEGKHGEGKMKVKGEVCA